MRVPWQCRRYPAGRARRAPTRQQLDNAPPSQPSPDAPAAGAPAPAAAPPSAGGAPCWVVGAALPDSPGVVGVPEGAAGEPLVAGALEPPGAGETEPGFFPLLAASTFSRSLSGVSGFFWSA